MITQATTDDYPRLAEIWESAVRATHHFLAPDDFEHYRRQLPLHFNGADLRVSRDESGVPLAFVGVADSRIEMLFVDASERGKGHGSRLTRYACNVLGAWRVNVNEQNAQAREFYERLGFHVTGRAALDGDGKPYPLLHMERPVPEIVLETPRLILRKLTPEDFRDACKLLQNPRVMYAYEGAFSDEEVRAWMDKMFRRYRENGFALWAAIDKTDGEVIGQCGITMQEVEGRWVPEVGYLLREEYWHRGFATEAARACKAYAFEKLGFPEVYSIIRDINLPSQRVALRNEMREWLRTTRHYKGIDMPHIVYRAERESAKI